MWMNGRNGLWSGLKCGIRTKRLSWKFLYHLCVFPSLLNMEILNFTFFISQDEASLEQINASLSPFPDSYIQINSRVLQKLSRKTHSTNYMRSWLNEIKRLIFSTYQMAINWIELLQLQLVTSISFISFQFIYGRKNVWRVHLDDLNPQLFIIKCNEKSTDKI